MVGENDQICKKRPDGGNLRKKVFMREYMQSNLCVYKIVNFSCL